MHRQPRIAGALRLESDFASSFGVGLVGLRNMTAFNRSEIASASLAGPWPGNEVSSLTADTLIPTGPVAIRTFGSVL